MWEWPAPSSSLQLPQNNFRELAAAIGWDFTCVYICWPMRPAHCQRNLSLVCFGPWVTFHIGPARALRTWRHQLHLGPRKAISRWCSQLLLRLQLITLPLATAYSLTPFYPVTLQAVAAPWNASRAETLQDLNTSLSVPLAGCSRTTTMTHPETLARYQNSSALHVGCNPPDWKLLRTLETWDVPFSEVAVSLESCWSGLGEF